MNKYKRRTINQKAHLHDKEFVVIEDVEEVIVSVIKMAVKCGADKKKLEEFFNNE
tara:strand:- start:2561 stop:2725 length:165 start_codon:yes stop_codon:yes gene_type:complete